MARNSVLRPSRSNPSMVIKENIPSENDMMFFTEGEKQRIHVFDTVRPSVVYISRIQQAYNPVGMNIMDIPAQTGSGFVWDNKHIVTNYHVVGSDKAEVQVTFVDNEGRRDTYKAKVRGVDVDKDVAVLSLVQQQDEVNKVLRPLTMGCSEALRVGQNAMAIGNPFGLDHTLTTGVVSGLGREIVSPGRRPIYNMIQTDAPINPGNSGGPLLDSMGRLIGMNTAIYSTSGASAGIGFAIPVDTLKAVVDIIIKDGKVVRPALGIQYLGGNQAKMMGVEKGLLILGVAPRSSAEMAGLRGTTRSFFSMNLGDIITAVNGKEVLTEADFLKGLDGKKVGDTMELTIIRNLGDRQSSRKGTTATTNAMELKVHVKLQPFEDAYSVTDRR
eukprot:CAMPEP_0182426036 /NCGR_PEP_ID=MMETSP1167-20130531/12520_1 /TAXON_ID=2988 /ORGANISM="Mallomonas Sp, Strain CCMP3275" /LENGTH=385 /DNA_ID=CAMNT_0024607191 /DNA_START=290 /DNA_END=1447 /DNA_ORIENTATION=+